MQGNHSDQSFGCVTWRGIDEIATWVILLATFSETTALHFPPQQILLPIKSIVHLPQFKEKTNTIHFHFLHLAHFFLCYTNSKGGLVTISPETLLGVCTVRDHLCPDRKNYGHILLDIILPTGTFWCQKPKTKLTLPLPSCLGAQA